MINTVRAVLGVIIGFVVIYVGSIEVPGHVLPLIFGPYSEMGDPPFIRTFTDFWLSAVFTVLGGYLAARRWNSPVVSRSLRKWVLLRIKSLALPQLRTNWR